MHAIELRPSIGSLKFLLGLLEYSPAGLRSRSKMLENNCLIYAQIEGRSKIVCARSREFNLNPQNARSIIEIITYWGKIEKFCTLGCENVKNISFSYKICAKVFKLMEVFARKWH